MKQARDNFKLADVDFLIPQVEGDPHREVTKLTGPIDRVFIGVDNQSVQEFRTAMAKSVNAKELGRLERYFIVN